MKSAKRKIAGIQPDEAVAVSVRLTPEMYEALCKEADIDAAPLTSVIRRAIRLYLEGVQR